MNKAILFIVLFAFAGLASASFKADTLAPMWSTWKNQHKKTYTAAQEVTRFGIFVENFNKVHRLNAESSDVKYAINKFADLTATEFKQIYASGSLPEPQQQSSRLSLRRAGSLPDSVDWRNKGGVTPVKNQGACGSCWAFSAVGALEGLYFAKSGELLSFSEQQIVDCATDNYGCNGGWPAKVFAYTATYGIETEADYPYSATDGECKYDSTKAIEVNSGFQWITPRSTDELKAALVNSPVSVAIEADQDVFQFYSSGVITAGCGASLNHGVLAVGYQKVGVLEAFIVKNSWGSGWGSDGYVYISTIQQLNNGQGVCGILAQPVAPK